MLTIVIVALAWILVSVGVAAFYVATRIYAGRESLAVGVTVFGGFAISAAALMVVSLA